MRLAVVVASDYRTSPGLPDLVGAPSLAGAVHQRLARPDTAFSVKSLAAGRELPEILEQRLGTLRRPAEQALLYFHGYVAWQPGRPPALVLDAERPRAFPLPRLVALIERHAGEHLVVLDVALPPASADRGAVADALCQVLGEAAPRASGLVSVAAAPPGGDPGALTERLLVELDGAAALGSALPSALFARLLQGATALERDRAIRIVPAAPTFPLLAAAAAPPARERTASRDAVASAPAAADPRVLAYQAGLLEQAAAFAQIQDWGSLAQIYEALLDTTPLESAPEIARWLVAYYRDVCRDLARARHALERAAAAAPGDAALKLELADACAEAGQLGLAIDHARAAVAAAPRDPAAYRRLGELFARAAQPDLSWSAAAALVHLGAADAAQAAFVTAGRPEGLLAATSTLREQHWQQELAPPVRHAALEQVLSIVAAAATEHELGLGPRQRRLPALDPAARQDPKTSTTTLCRSLTWTARLLGIPAPELYVEASDTASMLALPLRQPTTLVSKAFASGLTLPELTFLWGRHLTYFRPEHAIFVFYPTLDAMTRLLMASLHASDWDPKRLRDEDAATSRLAAHLHRALDAAALARLREATKNLTPARGRRRVQSYTEAIDRVANRAGLLACGDLDVAARMIERFPVETAIPDPLGDLLAFSVSQPFADLRAHLGVSPRP
ncbi:MAG TPA: hypothetical protein PLU22_08345 [Polyangiaceae bacterium]|nr:hypothetical protein [Polyangiaceae bacterium]